MEEKKRGRPKGSKNKVQVPKEEKAGFDSFYRSAECGGRLKRLMELGTYGTTKGDVICKALKLLEESDNQP